MPWLRNNSGSTVMAERSAMRIRNHADFKHHGGAHASLDAGVVAAGARRPAAVGDHATRPVTFTGFEFFRSNLPPIASVTVAPTPAAASAEAASGSTRKIAAGSVSGALTRCLSTPVLSPGEPEPVLSEDSARTTGPPLACERHFDRFLDRRQGDFKVLFVSQNFWAMVPPPDGRPRADRRW